MDQSNVALLILVIIFLIVVLLVVRAVVFQRLIEFFEIDQSQFTKKH